MKPITDTTELTRPDGFDAREFFSHDGSRTLVGPTDLEAAIPDGEKPYLVEIDRYWLDKPNSFAVIYHSRRENATRYFVVEPALTGPETTLLSFLDEQLRMEIDYGGISTDTTPERRTALIRETTFELLRRYRLLRSTDAPDGNRSLRDSIVHRIAGALESRAHDARERKGSAGRPRSPIVAASGELSMLTRTQVEALAYYLVRDFVGFARIDPLKHDLNVEDISCDGPGTELFIYHSKYEQLLTNIRFHEAELDTFVKRLANSSGKGISRRQPDIDTTLNDGSRAQLTLAEEITTKGSNFSIRQFLDIPFTPVDLINWRTFSIEQMAYLWLCIQYNRSIIFGGGTASGKTTTQNAVSLFIPSSAKIVSIEDTPELELPQKNWIASITRQSFAKDGMDEIDEYQLLENSLRQRPNYIIMGEVRGEEGRTLFQAMASGHTTFTTFHANTASQVIQRFTTDPINVQKPYFDTLDLISMQHETRVDGTKVRRCRELTEIGHYDREVDDVVQRKRFRWDASDDTFESTGLGSVLEAVSRENGWTSDELEAELRKREIVLAYLVANRIRDYGSVAGSIQGFMIDERAILHLVESGELENYGSNLRNISSLDIDVDPEREALVPRPTVPDVVDAEARSILDSADGVLRRYRAVDIGESFSLLDASTDDRPRSSDPAAESDRRPRGRPPLDRVDGDGDGSDDVTGAPVPTDDEDRQSTAVDRIGPGASGGTD